MTFNSPVLDYPSEDAEKLRLHTLSEAGDVDSLERMVDASDPEEPTDNSSNAP